MSHTLHDALDLYADGQMAVDELVPFVETYQFAPIIEGRGFPQRGTVQEIVDRWHTGQIPDEDYEQILDALGSISPIEAGVVEFKARPVYNPDARDADLDRIVQEGTPFARPATPRARALPKVPSRAKWDAHMRAQPGPKATDPAWKDPKWMAARAKWNDEAGRIAVALGNERDARMRAVMAATEAPPLDAMTHEDPDEIGTQYEDDDAAALAHPEVYNDAMWDAWLAWQPCREIRQAAARIVGVRTSALDPQRDQPTSSKGRQSQAENAPWMAMSFLRGLRENGTMHYALFRAGGRVDREQADALVASLPEGALVDLPLISAAHNPETMAYYALGSSEFEPGKMLATFITIRNAKGLDGEIVGTDMYTPAVEVVTGGRFRVVSAQVHLGELVDDPEGNFAGAVDIVLEHVGVFDPDGPPGTIIGNEVKVLRADRWVGVLHPWLDQVFDGPLPRAPKYE